jgi:uncharacterized protein YqgQ
MLSQTQIITKNQDRLRLKLLHCFPSAKGESQIIRNSRLPLYTNNQKTEFILPVAHIPLMINKNSAKCSDGIISTNFIYTKFKAWFLLPGNQENKWSNIIKQGQQTVPLPASKLHIYFYIIYLTHKDITVYFIQHSTNSAYYEQVISYNEWLTTWHIIEQIQQKDHHNILKYQHTYNLCL